MKDNFFREINYLSLSITDRCNLSCCYCQPRHDWEKLPAPEILRYEEFIILARVAARVGIKKVRVTGGEPLMRRGVLDFLRNLRQVEGLKEICLTTNGVLLGEMANDLHAAGVRHLNLSLDTLSPEPYREINGSDCFPHVMAGLEAAVRLGFNPLKINFVILKDINHAEVLDFAHLAQDLPLEGIEIGKTLTDPDMPQRLEGIAVEEPTISVDWIVNNSPFAGREGKFVTSRQVRDRLYKELEKNVALRVEPTDSPDTHSVSGRGELHLGILMETMRREGYEFQVSRPRVITREGPGGERLEPYEELMIDVPEEYMGVVMEKLGPRRAEMTEMRNPGQGMVRLTFRIPARGLFGYRSEFLTDTRGTGIMHHRYLEYGSWAGPLSGRRRGVLGAPVRMPS